MCFSQFSGKLKHKILSRDSISSFLLVQHVRVTTSKIQNILKDSYRPQPCICLHRVLSCHLVSNINSTISFIVKCNCFQFLFFVLSTITDVWSVLKIQTFLFALVNCQGCGLVVVDFCLQEFAGLSALL